jgi:hypothetical protein
MSDAAKQVAGEMVNVAEGFAVAKRVFQAASLGANSRDATILRDLIPPTPTPVPIPLGGDDRSVVPTSVTVDVGGITLTSGPTTGAQRYREIRQQAIDTARTIGPDAVAAVQTAFPPL